MDFQNIMRKEIIEKVFNTYEKQWAFLVYDDDSGKIIQPIFKLQDMLDYKIIFASHINAKREKSDHMETYKYPGIYFIGGSIRSTKVILDDVNAGIYCNYIIVSINPLEDSNFKMPVSYVNLDIVALEPNVFCCSRKNLHFIDEIIQDKIYITSVSTENRYSRELSEKFKTNKSQVDPKEAKVEEKPTSKHMRYRNISPRSSESHVDLCILNRKIDCISPLIEFFTFRSVLAELSRTYGEDDVLFSPNSDENRNKLFDIIKNKHIAEVGTILKRKSQEIEILFRKLKDDSIDISELNTLAVQTPDALQMKESIAKYANFLERGLKKIKMNSEKIEMEMKLSTGYDKIGKRYQVTEREVAEIINNMVTNISAKRRLLFLAKLYGIDFTGLDRNNLIKNGMDEKEIDLIITGITMDQGRRNPEGYRYEISRYVPVCNDVFRNFISGNYEKNGLVKIGKQPAQIRTSLRTTHMISSDSDRKRRRRIIFYIIGGICIEEINIANKVSEELEVEIVLGSNKILTPDMFINDLINEYQTIFKRR